MNMKKYDLRGLRGLKFKDSFLKCCVIQESSCCEPGIWLGVDNVVPRIFLPHISKNDYQKGWLDLPVPDYIHLNGKMHLDQEQVKELLPLLQYFAENGTLPPDIDSYDTKADNSEDTNDEEDEILQKLENGLKTMIDIISKANDSIEE